ncbi:hypothetical protein L204_100943 [Cryptococcus depauperatus]|nr:hypothetical protein L204_01125 [Cryptococcus depauperatus CBS 7855]
MDSTALPHSSSSNLHLTHPTADECVKIWKETFPSWGDSLTLPTYLSESQFLTTVPLAKDGGMTTWILVDKTLAPNQRPILCSCETFRKHSVTSDANGTLKEAIIHGIASVFCPPQYRHRGYGARHMVELAKVLRGWQSEYGKPVGSVLYSDIGNLYYAKLGWKANDSNWHLHFAPVEMEWPARAQEIAMDNLGELCRRDEEMVRVAMEQQDGSSKLRMVVLPDLDHILWHISKEEFACQYIFGKTPRVKGAMAGIPGQQVWVVWTHRYYKHPREQIFSNVLYILRLVMEGDETANKAHGIQEKCQSMVVEERVASLHAVLQAARLEAAEWKLDHVKLWEPSPLVQSLIARYGPEYMRYDRQEESLASALWYDEDEVRKDVVWINNEHYAWC